jgi:hypothetical protein
MIVEVKNKFELQEIFYFSVAKDEKISRNIGKKTFHKTDIYLLKKTFSGKNVQL